MIRRPTQRAALAIARRALTDVDRLSMGNLVIVKARRALAATADPLPIDMAQLRKLATAWESEGRHATEVYAVESFLKFCKENAK